MTKLLLFSRQAGTVPIFEPLIELIAERENFSFTLISAGASTKLWTEKGIQSVEEQAFDFKTCKNFDAILTGTSLEVSLDSRFWNAGKKAMIPTFAFVDSWVNYKQRFTIVNDLDALPDQILVVDKLMQDRLVNEGINSSIISIVGHPRFDTLLKKIKLQTSTLGEQKIIVIFTDPVIIDSENVKEEAGYCPIEVITSILDELNKHQASAYQVFVKPHPRENSLDYKNIIDQIGNDEFSISTEDPIELLLKADIVFGMNTILLIDSMKIGLPTYSFQPNRKVAQNDITDRDGIHLINGEDELFLAIHSLPEKRIMASVNSVEERRSSERILEDIQYTIDQKQSHWKHNEGFSSK